MQLHRDTVFHRADRVRHGWRTRASREGFTASQRVRYGIHVMRITHNKKWIGNHMSEKILIDSSEHILTITFNRPEKMNALDPDSFFQLAQALYRLQHDPELRVGVIQANGKHFTAGLELEKWAPIFAKGRMPELPPEHLDPYGISGEPLTKPLVMAVQGICYTSGLELLLNTDIRVATPETRFAQLEVKR